MRKSGIEHIKEQWFSHNGNVDRIQFFIASLITLPIISFSGFIALYNLLGFLFKFDHLLSQSDANVIIPIAIAVTFISLAIFYIFLRVFISFLIRRLNDLNLDKSKSWFLLLPIINLLFLFVLFLMKGVKDE